MTTYKRKQVTCRCDAYPFPHRQDSKACKELYNRGLEFGYEYEADSVQSLGLSSMFNLNNDIFYKATL